MHQRDHSESIALIWVPVRCVVVMLELKKFCLWRPPKGGGWQCSEPIKLYGNTSTRPFWVDCPHLDARAMHGCDYEWDAFLPCGWLPRVAAASAWGRNNFTALHPWDHSQSIAPIWMPGRWMVVLLEVMSYCRGGCLRGWRKKWRQEVWVHCSVPKRASLVECSIRVPVCCVVVMLQAMRFGRGVCLQGWRQKMAARGLISPQCGKQTIPSRMPPSGCPCDTCLRFCEWWCFAVVDVYGCGGKKGQQEVGVRCNVTNRAPKSDVPIWTPMRCVVVILEMMGSCRVDVYGVDGKKGNREVRVRCSVPNRASRADGSHPHSCPIRGCDVENGVSPTMTHPEDGGKNVRREVWDDGKVVNRAFRVDCSHPFSCSMSLGSVQFDKQSLSSWLPPSPCPCDLWLWFCRLSVLPWWMPTGWRQIMPAADSRSWRCDKQGISSWLLPSARLRDAWLWCWRWWICCHLGAASQNDHQHPSDVQFIGKGDFDVAFILRHSACHLKRYREVLGDRCSSGVSCPHSNWRSWHASIRTSPGHWRPGNTRLYIPTLRFVKVSNLSNPSRPLWRPRAAKFHPPIVVADSENRNMICTEVLASSQVRQYHLDVECEWLLRRDFGMRQGQGSNTARPVIGDILFIDWMSTGSCGIWRCYCREEAIAVL